MRSFGLLVILFAACSSPDSPLLQKGTPRGPECGHGALDADPHNCGECGHDCTTLPGVSGAECVYGVCVVTCQAGRAHCSGNADDGCEADLTSPSSCGACGNVCSGVCDNGSCAGGCSSGSNCNGQCVDTSTDPANCGGCGMACIAPANGHATCAASTCGVACDSGFTLDSGKCVASSTGGGGGWAPLSSGTKEALYGVWGAPSGDLFVVGANGTILHAPRGGAFSASDIDPTDQLVGVSGADATTVAAVGFDGAQGGVFREQSDGSWAGNGFVSGWLNAIWTGPAGDLWAVGDSGTILHNTSGHSWAPFDAGTSQPLWAVWGSGADDLYAVGKRGVLLHSDGTSFSRESTGTTTELMAVWGASATDVWVAGRGGLILHGAGDGTWTPEQSGTTDDLFALTGVGSDVYAVGDHGTILHRASGTWSADSSGTTNALWSIWGSSQDGLFAVGEAGTILHR